MAKAGEKVPTFRIDDARLIFRNFEGRKGTYNVEGARNFCVVIPPDDVEGMLARGWNVKTLEPREDGDEPTYYIQVAVGWNFKPPNIVTITSKGRTKLTEETCESLDWATFETVDLICRAHVWEVNGKTGYKAYLQTMYATIEEDDLDRKYNGATKKKVEDDD